VQDNARTLHLNGTWSVVALPLEVEGEAGYETYSRSADDSMAARVPGEIHLDLMHAGRLDDPDISDNARARCRWPEKYSWWYRTEFTLPPDFRKNLRQRLVFEGIDLYGQVFVNGQLAGMSKNAFVPVEFDVKGLLHDGVNELVVRVTSGMELVPRPSFVGDYGEFFLELLKIDSLYANRSWDQRRFLRKPAYNYSGWDWCDPLPNIGIWQAVRLEGRTKVVIERVRLDTVIRGNEVLLEGEVTLENLHPWSEIPAVLELRVNPPEGGEVVQRVAISAQVGRFAVPCRIVIPDPQLWWPNEMGAQPLYGLTVRVLCGDEETDRRVYTLGLRTLELDRSSLPDGSRFCFKVNGQEVFCKGGNWAPADLISARVDAGRYRRLVAEARNAHFTMIRINGCGLYESDDFYDACDRAGILVWQDFTFTDAQYPDQDPEFLELVRDEAEKVVNRLRHHASLALWCGNNECELSMDLIWKSDATKPEEIGGVKIYHEVLPELCHSHDPGRPYWPSSPFGGIDPNSPMSGDVHGFGGDGSTLGDRWRELIDEKHPRFVSEYLAMGPPHLASVREYLKPEEISFNSVGWRIHTNAMENGAILASIRYHYADTNGLSVTQFILYGQMIQALQLGEALEALRFRKGDLKGGVCDGALVWSYNDCWGEIGWSIIDHYERRKASYYWVRRAGAPIKVLVRPRAGCLVTRVVNDTLMSYQAVVRCGWVRVDGLAIEMQSHSVTIPVNGMIEVAAAAFPSPAERNPREWLYAATLQGEGIPEDQAIWLMAPHREIGLSKPVISCAIRDSMLHVSSPVYCHGVHIEDEGQPVLADNYFDLLPGTPRHIPITGPMPLGIDPLSAVLPIVSQDQQS
jgi:beta-mannosidase